MPLSWPILQAKAFQIFSELKFQDGPRVAIIGILSEREIRSGDAIML